MLHSAPVQPTDAARQIVLPGEVGIVDEPAKPAAPFGGFAQATSKATTGGGVAGGVAVVAPRKQAHPGAAAITTAKPGAANGPRDFKRFFDTVYQPLSDLAKELDVPEDYILGHSAYESGYLDNHDFPLNNPFGYTKAGGRNLAFQSIAAAVAAYRKDYGSQIRGAASAKDFVGRIQGMLEGKPVTGWRTYNTATKGYESAVSRVIDSIARHKEEWMKQRELVR
jgi:hypothetical protein